MTWMCRGCACIVLLLALPTYQSNESPSNNCDFEDDDMCLLQARVQRVESSEESQSSWSGAADTGALGRLRVEELWAAAHANHGAVANHGRWSSVDLANASTANTLNTSHEAQTSADNVEDTALNDTHEAAITPSANRVNVKSTSADQGACECLYWQDVYKQGLANCGDGFEFGPIRTPERAHHSQQNHVRLAGGRRSEVNASALNNPGVYFPWPHFNRSGDITARQYRMICTEQFLRRNDKMCAQIDMGETATQWCYTSASCSDLKGGKPVSEKVSTKTCSVWKDVLLLMMPPVFQIETIASQDLDAGVTMRMSYPTMKETWTEVKAYLMHNDNALDMMAEKTISKMRIAKGNGSPLVFDARERSKGEERLSNLTMTTQGDFVVAKNESIWFFQFLGDTASPHRRYKAICMRNCGPTKRDAWIVLVPTVLFLLIVLVIGKYCIIDANR
eukprot:gnl/TRDRNA2_/TRDRNA2_90293_c0_seq1.p1 gnl/TRDRNA2_/TRDRNA2_90293_c0~~gnl/TRDRNA2_/TRDRNA2_90293_c0_seq1.p1  ORF type:complete len:449 (+),score=57.08 gnl/TRDRNA2_/TRDRNA2_90293_c0_seq1:56-1402(+)